MKVRFWGVRGSVPTPGPRTVRYGGNTSCVEVIAGEASLVLDAGTGICELGRVLAARGGSVQTELLITHTHMDHIQGFPFFVPAFIPGNRIDVYGPKEFDKGLFDVFRLQMDYSFFPVRVSELAATVEFHDLSEDRFAVGPFRIAAQALNHPVLTLGYRIEAEGSTLVYAPDHEPYFDFMHGGETRGLSRQAIEETVRAQNDRIVEFLGRADLLVLDSQYTPQEYEKRHGWGHSSWSHSVDLALAAQVRHFVLFHHEPTRDDDGLERVLGEARARAAAAGSSMEISLAREGWTVEVGA
ncbi:MAG: MBL fold metallo-hydrolase [Planctomycetes bacterium]|nr:MBL fold metallo-hydrolase [Planctomycetota bacterium]